MSLCRQWRYVGLYVVFGLCAAGQLLAQTAGCTLAKQVYTCDRAQFQRTLTAAKTVRIETAAQDRVAEAKLRDLTVRLGKAIAEPESKADLTFSLIAVSTDGVLVGPAGVDLAVLRIYGHDGAGAKGDLVWAETYRGQPDMSWPAVVQETIQQFRAGFKR